MWDTIHDDFVQFCLSSFNYTEFLYEFFNKGRLRLFLEKYLGILLVVESLSLFSWSHINLWLSLLHCVSYHWNIYDSLGAYNSRSRDIHSSHFGFYMGCHGVGKEAYEKIIDIENWL